jgi:hypothetical protein
MALLIGLGVSALELDLRHAGFGWRQLLAGVSVAALVVAAVPFFASFVSGRFDLPSTSVAESLSALAPANASGYRVLWLADPSVAPIAGWSVAPGLEAATSTNGLPGGATLFAPPDSSTSDVLLTAVQLALQGRTVRLGQLLAPAGISTIVVMNSSSPELAGVQSVPLRPVPTNLVTALSRQTDLALELQTRSVEVFSNSLFHGLVSASSASSSSYATVLNGDFAAGSLPTGTTVIAGLAPASAFALDFNGAPAPRSVAFGWVPTFSIAKSPGTAANGTGQIVMQQPPFDGVLAGLTLGLWAFAWLGFGSVQRIERLFIRRRSTKSPRHAKGDHRG